MTEGSSKNTAWIIVLTSVATVAMTVFNGFTSYRINDTKTAIEQQAQDLEAARARIERYGFVQKLFGDLLSTDSSKRTLTINLVTLTLTPEEAQKLFAGLQTSSNAAVRSVGDAGTAALATDEVAPLVNQLNAGTSQMRIAAYNQLRDRYTSSAVAITQTLALYDEARIDQLSASGRINTLEYLAITDPAAWTPEQVGTAQAVVKRILNQQATRKWRMGERTLQSLDRFRKHLKQIEQAQTA